MLYPLKLAEKVPDFFHFFGLSLFLAFVFFLHCIYILLCGCIFIVSKIDQTNPGPAGPFDLVIYNIYNLMTMPMEVCNAICAECSISNFLDFWHFFPWGHTCTPN